MMSKAFAGKIALVTGASRGIGYQIALQLGQAGAHVLAVARTVGGLEELDDEIKAAGGSATLVPLDLKDHEAIDRLGAALYERFGKLDILVGNAAVLGDISPLGHVSPKSWDEVLAVNVTANWRLIRSLDPLLRRAEAARALFVSSGAAKSRRAYWGPYSVSKAALEALVETYAHETETTALKVNLLDPGKTRTAMRARAMPGEDPDTLPRPALVAADALTLLTPEVTQSGHVFVWRDGGFVG
jgi:NAD(P)-dependent dehydrogenase (short-subunit alcohol dehydrogenase family)